MKNREKSSLCVPQTLKNLLKQRASAENCFIPEYIARLLLHDLERQPGHAIRQVPQSSLSQAELGQKPLGPAEPSLPQEVRR
jgi:hypothetical protein